MRRKIFYSQSTISKVERGKKIILLPNYIIVLDWCSHCVAKRERFAGRFLTETTGSCEIWSNFREMP